MLPVKLIVTDMDGTLLNSQKQLPPDLNEVLLALKAKNIKFVIASGRQYYNVAALFPEHYRDMVIIAENGGYISAFGEMVHFDPLTTDQLQGMMSLVETLDNVYPVFACQSGAYTLDTVPEETLQQMKAYYTRLETVSHWQKLPEPVCKVAVCDPQGASDHAFPICHKISNTHPELLAVLSGDIWVDMARTTTNKGCAVENLQKEFGISYEETMVFGDYLNDYTMMQTGKYSFAMANALDELKAAANYEAPSNDDWGVTKTIRALCLE